VELFDTEIEDECTTVRLKLPERFQTLTHDDLDIINTECIKMKDGAVLIKDDEVGVYVVGLGIERNANIEKLVENTKKITLTALKKYERLEK
jgi:hypothetical protein